MSATRDNRFGTVGVVLGLVAAVSSLLTENVVVVGLALAGLVFTTLGMWRAVRVDYGMARSLTGLLLALFAVVAWVFSKGVSG